MTRVAEHEHKLCDRRAALRRRSSASHQRDLQERRQVSKPARPTKQQAVIISATFRHEGFVLWRGAVLQLRLHSGSIAK